MKYDSTSLKLPIENLEAEDYLPLNGTDYIEFYVGNADVEIGTVRNTSFYMSAEQFAYWEHTHITLDAIKGTGG